MIIAGVMGLVIVALVAWFISWLLGEGAAADENLRGIGISMLIYGIKPVCFYSATLLLGDERLGHGTKIFWEKFFLVGTVVCLVVGLLCLAFARHDQKVKGPKRLKLNRQDKHELELLSMTHNVPVKTLLEVCEKAAATI